MVGAIAAEGDLEVHHGGFRAERARIVALALPYPPELRLWGGPFIACAQATAEQYGVPLVEPADLADVAGEHGSTVPNELRPAEPDPLGFSSRIQMTLTTRTDTAEETGDDE